MGINGNWEKTRTGEVARLGEIGRRRFIALSGASAAALVFGTGRSAEGAETRPRFSGYPFTLGVASGDPQADGVVLWTRLAPKPLAEDGRVYVWVAAAQDTTQDEPDASRDEYRDTAQDARVEDLREQVAYLRRQLDEEREARRRADLILGQLSQANAEQARTIRAIESPASEDAATEDAETVEEAPERATAPPPPRSDTPGPQTAPQRGTLRGLRRRILGW